MSATIRNYDGSVATTPQQFARPGTVAELQDILKQTDRYPSPVRAMGSFHSLTPCAATPGTLVSTAGLKRIVHVDVERMTFTAQAGLQMIEATEILRRQNLQFVLNVEIGNMTLGAAACCQSKDSLDGVEFGQVNSYVTNVKWVNPSGGLEEASADKNPELLSLIRASYGLAGVVYEVTLKIKPLEIVRFDYRVHDVGTLTQDYTSEIIASNQSVVFWTVERKTIIQTRNRADRLRRAWRAVPRRFFWRFFTAWAARAIHEYTPWTAPRNSLANIGFRSEIVIYRWLAATGGFSLYDSDKMIDYSRTPPSGRYGFSFWAFPRGEWVRHLQDYVPFRESYFEQHGFRTNMPLGSYFIRQDTSSLLSYTYDGDIISIDPIHASCTRDQDAWARFLEVFNDWAHQRGGIPLLNQTPFVKKPHVLAAYGERWKTLCDWIRVVDPQGRMVNPFFQELMW